MASAEGLARGTRYFVSVRATDGAGHRAAATSDGMWIEVERGAQQAAPSAQQLPRTHATYHCDVP